MNRLQTKFTSEQIAVAFYKQIADLRFFRITPARIFSAVLNLKSKRLCKKCETRFCIFLKACNRRSGRNRNHNIIFFCSDYSHIRRYNDKPVHLDVSSVNSVWSKTHQTYECLCIFFLNRHCALAFRHCDLAGEIRLKRCDFICKYFCEITCKFLCFLCFCRICIDKRHLTLSCNCIIFCSACKVHKKSFCIFQKMICHTSHQKIRILTLFINIRSRMSAEKAFCFYLN